jgi:hypothetical protein
MREERFFSRKNPLPLTKSNDIGVNFSGRRPGLIQNQKKKSTWSVSMFVCHQKSTPLFSLRKMSKTWIIFSFFVSKEIFFVWRPEDQNQFKDAIELVEGYLKSLLWQYWKSTPLFSLRKLSKTEKNVFAFLSNQIFFVKSLKATTRCVAIYSKKYQTSFRTTVRLKNVSLRILERFLKLCYVNVHWTSGIYILDIALF